MPKLKTTKSVKKRYKIISKNKFLRKNAYKAHLLEKQSNKQKRKLSKSTLVKYPDIKAIRVMLGY